MLKVAIYVRLKKEILDAQGAALARALDAMGFTGIHDVRIGKLIELEVEGTADEVETQLRKIAEEMLANPVIEDYEIKIEAG